jgi:acyl carrier protein
MVEQGARHLVLAGRSNASAEAQTTLDALKQAGAQMITAQIDVAKVESVANLLAEIRTAMPPLKGIIHAAGVLADSTLAQMDNERFYAALRPKINGAWNLHAQTLAEPLDFFVLFSSVAAVLGTTGQGNYAAGNAFLDALAQHRRVLGKPAMSINWGSWSQVGLAAAQANRGERLEARGLGSITPEQGLAAMALLLQEQPAQAVFMSLDVPRWQQFYPAASLLADLAGERNKETRSQTLAHANLRAQLLAAPFGEQRRTLMEVYLQEQVAQVLKLKPDRVPLNKPLRMLGLDSLMALELRYRLEVTSGLTLPATMFFNYPTINLLAPHLAGKMKIPLEARIIEAPKEENAGELKA